MGKLILACLGALLALNTLSPAFAGRTFPDKAKRGELKAHQYPSMRIGDKTYRLAPGGRIFNQQNLIIVPVSLPARPAQIMYTIDMNGDLSRVWLLTPEEAAQYPVGK
jgi:hypothetical protein